MKRFVICLLFLFTVVWSWNTTVNYFGPENLVAEKMTGSDDKVVQKLDEEKEAPLQVCQTLQNYLYEPHAALLKSGAFKLIATRLNLFKLHRHSHLYTSESLCQDFPGRIFTIEETYEFSGKLLKQLYRQIPKANLTTRNFPLTVAELRKRSNIKEGGDIYLFATTLYSGQRVLIRTHKTH